MLSVPVATFIITSHSTSKQTAKCRRAEADSLVKRTSVAAMMRSGVTRGRLDWNHDRAVERGLIPEEFEGVYCHDIIHDMQAMCIDDEKRIFPGFQNVNDYASTQERFYTPIVDRIRALKLDDKIPCDDAFDLQNVDISESLRFVASREAASSNDAQSNKESKIPITPVTSYEKTIFEKMLPDFQKQTTNANQHTSYDFLGMAKAWDDMVDREWSRHRNEIRHQVFRKSASLLARYYKTYLRKENTKKTIRQSVRFKNQEGVTTTGTVKAGLSEIRTGFKTSSCEHSFQEPVNETPNLQTPAAVRNSSHDVLMPPIEIHRAREDEGIMNSIAAQRHLRMPSIDIERRQTQMQEGTATRDSSAATVRGSQRCYRCGKPRTGEQHHRKSAPNSVDYCSVPREDRYHPKWDVPYGWNVGDASVKSEGIRKSLMRNWKRIREINNIPSDDRFPGW
jgi:hypothetical protein